MIICTSVVGICILWGGFAHREQTFRIEGSGVLLPGTWAAVRDARANRLQSSLNPAIGSALAGIGLTVPVVVPASIVFD
jgi:Ca2+/H+ antiporter